ncbi:hypothetical protein CPJCM30710_16190 [Clostridium polyendosporum]|uniref:Uncharacterized protein n=1 Tax=Clostridium polyendosporum TaxID=69208 RepID=A0A919VLV0_9CLOT|nr:hypothetical protein [Clostridium polyendosporum]GIM28953.1 hypothetical protein CPJCM30710_16190 [Clostridium polyendosporum]
MSKYKDIKSKQQSMIAESEDSRTAQNGFLGRGNSGVQPGIRDTKGKR